MGVIRVKLANNYETDQADAAASYFSQKEVKIIAPDDIIPGTWQLSNTLPYDQAFGAIAKTTDSTEPYWGFSVCFLFNQMTGYTDLYDKYLASQSAAGDISSNYQKWWAAGNELAKSNFDSNVNAGSLQEMATFLHPAQLAIDRLNEISNQDVMDIDFTYPSPIHQDQPNFYLNDIDPDIPLRKRTMQTSQRVLGKQIPGTDPKQNEGFGAYGDNPWPKCSMLTFFSVQAFRNSTIENIQSDMKESYSECEEKQNNEWNTQWEDINGPGPAEAKSASIPSDAFDLFTNGDVNNLFEAWMKYQTDGSAWAAEVQKAVASEIGINGQISFTEQDGKRYARVGGSFLNEPQTASAAKAIKKAIHDQGA